MVTERRHDIGVLYAVSHIFAHWTSPVSAMHVIFFIVECGIVRFLSAMRVFEVRASSSPSTFDPNVVSFATSTAELAHEEKLRTHSITHPTYWMCWELKILL